MASYYNRDKPEGALKRAQGRNHILSLHPYSAAAQAWRKTMHISMDTFHCETERLRGCEDMLEYDCRFITDTQNAYLHIVFKSHP